jgi:hypothetical protein
MSTKTQTFASHTRWNPLYHFVASPLTGLYMVYALVQAFRAPSGASLWHAVWAVGIWAAVLSARLMALTVQNRVIRLEMRLRLKDVLPAELQAKSRALSTRHLIALRFAGDAELPGLVERTLAGEFARPKDIKRAITNWQADWLRA